MMARNISLRLQWAIDKITNGSTLSSCADAAPGRRNAGVSAGDRGVVARQ